jgi:hypothetical protein
MFVMKARGPQIVPGTARDKRRRQRGGSSRRRRGSVLLLVN